LHGQKPVAVNDFARACPPPRIKILVNDDRAIRVELCANAKGVGRTLDDCAVACGVDNLSLSAIFRCARPHKFVLIGWDVVWLLA
jgi:hypothetical protein